MPPAIILDFDGVIADSEVASMWALRQIMKGRGLSLPLEVVTELFLGRRWEEAVKMVELQYGFALPQSTRQGWHERIYKRLGGPMRPVRGLHEFLTKLPANRLCIASSSKRDWIDPILQQFCIEDLFRGRIISGEDVTAGKPAPDVFLLAAARLGGDGQALVIEDSVLGVEAAIAADMIPIGLGAGSHMTAEARARLTNAGARHVFATYAELSNFLDQSGEA